MDIDERNVFWDWSDPAQRADLARYVLEKLDEIAKIVKEAEEDLKKIPPWYDPSFDGYVSRKPERVRAQVSAIFQRLQKWKPRAGKYLTYRVEPPDSFKGRQRLRLAREILHRGHSECLGWVLIFAACVLHVRINPLVIITRNKKTGDIHALLGYWLCEKSFEQVVVSGEDVETNVSRGYIKAVNATRVAVDEKGGTRSFEEAENEAHEGLLPPSNPDWEILFAVDLRRAREKGTKALFPLEPWSGNHPIPPARHFQWRQELEDIRKWWQDESSYGVLTLVGLGGAGKTALVHRFLAQIPMSGIQETGVGKDETLPIPDALFVWSFYQHPDVDQCATALYNYLTNGQVNKATFEQVQEVLSRNWRGSRILLVFDGIEKLQTKFGQFLTEGVPLGRFLGWCCDGPRPVHALVTSRFNLTTLRNYRGYHALPLLPELTTDSARAVLRATGVDGLNWQLDELGKKFGKLPLTLELLGNYIFLVHKGDPTPLLARDILELESEEVRVQTDEVDTEILSQKLASVLQFYKKLLQEDDPAVLAVLQRLCLFHIIPADENLLARIFSKGSQGTAGPLAGLNQQQIRRHLLNLCNKYRLIRGEPAENPKQFKVHPVIRDYFKKEIGKPLEAIIHAEIAGYLSSIEPLASLVEEIKEIDSEVVFWSRAVKEPVMDMLEELIYHLAHPSRKMKYDELWLAWHLYFLGMGGFDKLGKRLGLYSRGVRLMQLLRNIVVENLEVPFSNDPLARLGYIGELIPKFLRIRSQIINELGIFSFSLGELATASKAYRGALELATELKTLESACVFSANLCEAYLMQGRLKKAIGAGAYGLETARVGNHEWELDAFNEQGPWIASTSIVLQEPELYDQLEVLSAYTGYALALRGYSSSAQTRFWEAVLYFQLLHKHPIITATLPIVEFLMDKVARKEDSNLRPSKLIFQLVRKGILFSIAGVYQAAFAFRLGRFERAHEMLTNNKNVCKIAGLKRDVARCNLLHAEIYRIQKKVDKARRALAQAIDWGNQTGDQEVLLWGNLVHARLALDTSALVEAERAIREGLRIAEYSGYGLYWIDLQVVKGQWELACGRQLQAGRELPPELEIWTPQQWFERAEASALRALNGHLKNSDDPAPRPDLPEDQLAMLGACHPECGYAWGEGDALQLLAEARFKLAQRIGLGGYDSKGRSYSKLLEEARQAAGEALALRERIQDPKAKETRDLLAKIREIRGGDGS